MMRTIIKEKETKRLEFPCLMKSDNGLVVLFTMPHKGFVISEGADWAIGHYADNWNMSDFLLLNGEIILSND